MKVLVTGATGVVGSRLCKELVKLGHELSILSRSKEPVLPFPAICYQHDLASPIPEGFFKDTIDIVVHLAGENIAGGRWTAARKKSIYDSRVNSTRVLQEYFQRHIPKAWIQSSATGYYPDTGDLAADELFPAGHTFLSKVCKDWEHAVENLSDRVRTVIFRTSVILEKRSGFLSKLLPIFRLGLGGVIGNGSQYLSWVHIDDVVNAYLEAISNDKFRGIYNLASPQAVTNKEFSLQLAKVLGKPCLATVPKFALKVAMGEMSIMATQSQRVYPKALISENIKFKFKFESLTAALEDLIDFEKDVSVHELYVEQYVPAKRADVFPFFANEKNLETLTPAILNFKVLRKSTEVLTEGTLIDYKLKVRGLPTRWRTRIESWDPPHKFVDTQLKGPYALWHHTHKFIDMGPGTLMSDRVLYKLPVWPFGLMALAVVKKDVHKIFNFRFDMIKNLFPNKESLNKETL